MANYIVRKVTFATVKQGATRPGAIIAATAATTGELVADVFAEGNPSDPAGNTCGRRWMPSRRSRTTRCRSVSFAVKFALDKSAASRRLRGTTERGDIVNLETRGGRSARSSSAIRCRRW
jgi:hypothetical protein